MTRLLRLIGLVWLASVVAAVAGALTARRRVMPADAPDADEIGLVTTFAPLDYRSTATAFRSGAVECWFGGGTIDLRSATLDPAGADLRVVAAFGGGQLIVPPEWRVVSHVVGVGGIGDARDVERVDELGPELRIDGTFFLGGFGITSEPMDEEMTVPA